MARKIVITSGKGGVGKTTVAANLALSIARLNLSVCLIDLDIGLNNLDVQLRAEDKVVYDLSDIIAGRCRIKQAFIEPFGIEKLKLIPSSKVQGNKIKEEELTAVIRELDPMFDIIIIDSPAGIDEGFHRAARLGEEAIVVTNPQINAIRDADKVVNILSQYELKKVGLVVNRVSRVGIERRDLPSPIDISELLRVPLVGVLPESTSIYTEGILEFTRDNEIKKAYQMLAVHIIGGEGKVYDPIRGGKGLFSRLIELRRT